MQSGMRCTHDLTDDVDVKGNISLSHRVALAGRGLRLRITWGGPLRRLRRLTRRDGRGAQI